MSLKVRVSIGNAIGKLATLGYCEELEGEGEDKTIAVGSTLVVEDVLGADP